MTQLSSKFDSLLIANRGEIACRIIKTARTMGLRTIAVYSQADAKARHVGMADEAFLLGPAPAADSYLSIERLMEVIKKTQAQAVHPGYGFVSENAQFARQCAEQGIVFVGPSPDAITIMGDKAHAKSNMIEAGVPCIPGYQGADQSDESLIYHADKIGYPLMIKAAAGGGGRGMRLVHQSTEMASALTMARSEALNAFGSDHVILEKAIKNARHVEIQILADQQGTILHLGERDCSVQRRHQKVIEEAPCPVVNHTLRNKMGRAAIEAAKAVNYVGAGTVEFLLDATGAFYFLEMNTRLQVEHPVTEMVTGLDLVALQLRIAQGNPLPLTQDELRLKGHAIEARLYAEDPANQFLPASGKINLWQAPIGKNIRVDHGIDIGTEVSPFYDPMLAKIIAYGENREEARASLIRALNKTILAGVSTNRTFLIDILTSETFSRAGFTTNTLEAELGSWQQSTDPILDASIAATLLYEQSRSLYRDKNLSLPIDLLNWTSAGALSVPFQMQTSDDLNNPIKLRLTPETQNTYMVETSEGRTALQVLQNTPPHALMNIEGKHINVTYAFNAPLHRCHSLQIILDNRDITFTNGLALEGSNTDEKGAGILVAPMHGLISDITAAKGDHVKKGQSLGTLEAMKMQHAINADIDGTLIAINIAIHQQVSAGDKLFLIDPELENNPAQGNTP